MDKRYVVVLYTVCNFSVILKLFHDKKFFLKKTNRVSKINNKIISQKKAGKKKQETKYRWNKEKNKWEMVELNSSMPIQ